MKRDQERPFGGPLLVVVTVSAGRSLFDNGDFLDYVTYGDRFDDFHPTDYLSKHSVAAVKVRDPVQGDIELTPARGP